MIKIIITTIIAFIIIAILILIIISFINRNIDIRETYVSRYTIPTEEIGGSIGYYYDSETTDPNYFLRETDTGLIAYKYFYNIGGIQNFTIEEGVTELNIYCWGAGGGYTKSNSTQLSNLYPLVKSTLTSSGNSIDIILQPVVWYKFDDATNLGLDSSGNGYNMTNNNSVSTITGIRGLYGVNFNGSQYFSANSFNFSNKSFSIAVWIYPTNNSRQLGFSLHTGSGYNRNSLWCGYNEIESGNTNTYAFSDRVDNWGVGGYASDVNTWVHIVFTYDLTTKHRRIYRNGVLIGTRTTPATFSYTGNIFELGRIGTSGYYTYGRMDDFRVYNKELTEQEVNQLYSNVTTTAASGIGGAGGFVKSTLLLDNYSTNRYSSNLTIIVGRGGDTSLRSTISDSDDYKISRGFSGVGVINTENWSVGDGGGSSGIFTSRTDENGFIPIVTAGGGGAGGYEFNTNALDESLYIKSPVSPNIIAGTNDIYFSFTSVGTSSIIFNKSYTCDILIIGGGGGGGNYGAGGGGGDVIYITNRILNSGTYSIIVGGGGDGGSTKYASGLNGSISSISNSSDASFITIFGAGGGGGGGYDKASTTTPTAGSIGAGNYSSGGGGGKGSGTATGRVPGTGNGVSGNGGDSTVGLSGGGGGAVGNGSNATTSIAGNGGAGLSNSITGTSITYGGGGGGGTWHARTTAGIGIDGGGNGSPENGTPTEGATNRGGGGGGGGSRNGANGGSGIVIIRVKNALTPTSTTSLTTTSSLTSTVLPHGGNGGGMRGFDGNGSDNSGGKGGQTNSDGTKIDGIAGFINNVASSGNPGRNGAGGNGVRNQAGGGAGHAGGGCSGHRTTGNNLLSIGGSGGGSSYINTTTFNFRPTTIVNTSNAMNGLRTAPGQNEQYYRGGTDTELGTALGGYAESGGKRGGDGLVVLEYFLGGIGDIDGGSGLSVNAGSCSSNEFIKYPKIFIERSTISAVSTIRNGFQQSYTNNGDIRTFQFSSYNATLNTPVYLFDGYINTAAHFNNIEGNTYDINDGRYLGRSRYEGNILGEDGTIGQFESGEFLVVKLNNAIQLRKYEIIADKDFLNRAPGIFKLYAKMGETNNYKLLHSVDARLSVRLAQVGNYTPIINAVSQQYLSFTKRFCDNQLMSDTYVLVVTGLATPIVNSQDARGNIYRRRGNYLSFNEFNLYHGNRSTILTTHIGEEV